MKQRWVRQGVTYFMVGLAQLALDAGLFSLIHALTGATVVANLSGRVCGAVLGYFLNGTVTFSEQGERKLGLARLSRFVVLWLAMTTLSTLGVMTVEWLGGSRAVYLGKPVVELILAALGFVISKHWVYR